MEQNKQQQQKGTEISPVNTILTRISIYYTASVANSLMTQNESHWNKFIYLFTSKTPEGERKNGGGWGGGGRYV